jgi:hypothetical protein
LHPDRFIANLPTSPVAPTSDRHQPSRRSQLSFGSAVKVRSAAKPPLGANLAQAPPILDLNAAQGACPRFDLDVSSTTDNKQGVRGALREQLEGEASFCIIDRGPPLLIDILTGSVTRRAFAITILLLVH